MTENLDFAVQPGAERGPAYQKVEVGSLYTGDQLDPRG
jgi:hypothetical protein